MTGLKLVFHSIGCLNDWDCAVNMSMLNVYDGSDQSDKMFRTVRGYPFNFQECRLIDTGGLPDEFDPNKNGCLCPNYLTSAEQYVDTNGSVHISCTKIDSGSIFYFTIQSITTTVFFFVSLRCIYIFLFFLPSLVSTLHHRLYAALNKDFIRRKEDLSFFKQHALLCLFILFASSFCVGLYKISETISYHYAIPYLQSSPGKQQHISDDILFRVSGAGHSLFELAALHFTILWISAAPISFFNRSYHNSNNHNNCSNNSIKPKKESCHFNMLWYKRFIYVCEIITIFPILLMGESYYLKVNLLQIAIGSIIVFEFSLGCKLISERLRAISNRHGLSSSPEQSAASDDSSNGKKLNEMAYRIDQLAKKFRICGAMAVVLYFPYTTLCDVLHLDASTTTFSNPRSYLKEPAHALFAVLHLFLFNFLHDSLFGFKDARKQPQIDLAVNKNVMSIGDLSPDELLRIKNMKSDASVLDSSAVEPNKKHQQKVIRSAESQVDIEFSDMNCSGR